MDVLLELSLPVWLWPLPYLHRLRQGINRKVVVLDLLNFMPWETGWVFDRVLKLGLRLAICDDVEPVAVAAVLGDAALVGRKQDGSSSFTDSFDFN